MPATPYTAAFIQQYASWFLRKTKTTFLSPDSIAGLNNEFSLISALCTAANYTAVTQSQDPRLHGTILSTSNGFTEVQAGSALSGVSISPAFGLSGATTTTDPITFTVLEAPSWATINPTTGVVTGTPALQQQIFNMNTGGSTSNTSNESQYILVSISDAFGPSADSPVALLFTVVSPNAPVVTSSATATGVHATSFSYTVTGSNTPTSFQLTDDTTGVLAINASTGVVSCATLPAAGSYQFTVTATNSYGASMNFNVTLTVS